MRVSGVVSINYSTKEEKTRDHEKTRKYENKENVKKLKSEQ